MTTTTMPAIPTIYCQAFGDVPLSDLAVIMATGGNNFYVLTGQNGKGKRKGYAYNNGHKPCLEFRELVEKLPTGYVLTYSYRTSTVGGYPYSKFSLKDNTGALVWTVDTVQFITHLNNEENGYAMYDLPFDSDGFQVLSAQFKAAVIQEVVRKLQQTITK